MQSKILLVYKDVSANPGMSHIGLGVTAFQVSRVLRNAGLDATSTPGFAMRRHTDRGLKAWRRYLGVPRRSFIDWIRGKAT